MKSVLILKTAIVLGLLTACGQQQQEKTERQEVGGAQFQEPSTEGLPEIKLMPYDSEEFSLTADKNQELKDLFAQAKEKVDAAFYSGNNIVITGVHYSTGSFKDRLTCTRVQIQQRKAGRVIVKDDLVPEGQDEDCEVNPGKGLNLAVMGILLKIENNWAGGIGVGAVAYVEPYLAGCAAGAVGYVLANGAAGGTAGAFCTKIYSSATLQPVQ